MKILGKVAYGLFITLLLGVTGLFLATLMPIPGNIEIKIVKSGSMEPSIPVGSIVVVKPAATYVAGDVITFGKDSGREIPTTHRIANIQTESGSTLYTTKGDANEEADSEQILRDDIIGKVFVHVPYAGYVLDFARQPIGFSLLIGVPAALIILEELLSIFKETRKLFVKNKGGGRGYAEVPQKPPMYRPRVPTI